MIFTAHAQAKQRIDSAAILIKLLLSHGKQHPEVLARHYEELLTILLGKITEADSKDKTRYRSQGAISYDRKPQHEHVFQRSRMIRKHTEAGSEEEINRILKAAVACAVTYDEHKHLHRFDHLYGWERYEKAGIVVMDTITWPPRPADLKLLIDSSLH